MTRDSYRSYGKINLYLDIRDRRTDGFTNIETVLQSIDLWDRLQFEARPSGISLTCSDPALGNGPENLVYRAAESIQKRAGITSGVSIHLEKNLPVAAGLAGGSGNAAATLVALNSHWQLGWSTEQLCELGAELGSDVPFCLVGGTVAATGRGEILEPLPLLPPHWLVLVHPPLAITAGHAYGHPNLSRNISAPKDGKTPAFRTALERLASNDPAPMVFNRMESGIFVDHPELAEIKHQLLEHGCQAAAMSGSGPTVFGLCTSENDARDRAGAFPGYRTSVVQTTTQGVRRE